MVNVSETREQGPFFHIQVAEEQSRPYNMCVYGAGVGGNKVHRQNRHATVYKDDTDFQSWKREKKEKGKAIQRWTGLYLGG